MSESHSVGRQKVQRQPWGAGEAYEDYMGRWSRLAARKLIDWLAVAEERQWLDIGCGTGALTETILTQAAPTSVIGIDWSDGFIAHARRQISDARAHFEAGDAQALPFPDGAFDAVVSGLVLNFIPQPAKAIAEMRRTLRPGGTAGIYVWDYADKMQMMRRFWDAATALDPGALTLEESRRFAICKPEPLLALFRDGGFERAECRSFDIPMVFADFDDYWQPFLGRQGSAPAYCGTLNDDQRTQLRAHIRATLPVADDGTIRLIARAWAVRGARPSSQAR